MTKKRLLVLGFVVVIIGGFFICFLNHKNGHNELFVTVDNSLSTDKIRIDMGFYSINSGSDENLIKLGLNEVVYSDNKTKSFETICGENDFFVVYDNKFYTIVRHFIPNDFYDGIPKPHKYNFDFKRIGERIHLTLNIEGEDEEKIEKDLVSVAGANNNIWGRQIEK